MKLRNIITTGCFAIAIATTGLIASCQPDEVEGGNALSQGDLDATFSAVTDNGNNYTFVGSDDSDISYHTWKWTSADGSVNPNANSGEMIGESTAEFTFATPGTYVVQHRVVGHNGGTNSVTEQTIVVTTFALEDNVVSSPNFETPSDWTILNISNNNAVNWTFNNGSATASGGDTSYSGKGIFQAVELTAGRYLLDMHAEGPGSTDTWFEVYLSQTAPVQGSDYSAGGIRIALNTWAGCGNTPFNGQLAAISCAGSGAEFDITESGTYYMVIKTGSGAVNGVNSITISDVSLRRFLD